MDVAGKQFSIAVVAIKPLQGNVLEVICIVPLQFNGTRMSFFKFFINVAGMMILEIHTRVIRCF